MALPNSTVEFNLNLGSAPPASPMIALLLIPPSVGRFTVNILPIPARDDHTIAGILTEPPPSSRVENVCEDTERPASPCRLPPQDAPKVLTPKKALSPKTAVSPKLSPRPRAPKVLTPTKALSPKKARSPSLKGSGTRLPTRPTRRAPPRQRPATPANAEAGPSRLPITQVAPANKMLVLPPIPVDIFEELTSLFDNHGSYLAEPDTSDEEAKRRKFGRDMISDE